MNNRLTQKDNVHWCVKGLPWENLSIGVPVTQETWEHLYGALHKLLDYEEVGPSPQELMLIDDFYRERCEEINRLQEENEKLKKEIEAITKSVLKFCKSGYGEGGDAGADDKGAPGGIQEQEGRNHGASMQTVAS
jgi:hypothetical protein